MAIGIIPSDQGIKSVDTVIYLQSLSIFKAGFSRRLRIARGFDPRASLKVWHPADLILVRACMHGISYHTYDNLWLTDGAEPAPAIKWPGYYKTPIERGFHFQHCGS